jgi:hypothetical protein
MSKQKTYGSVDRATYQQIQQGLRERGIGSGEGDSGIAHAAGVRMHYSYSEQDQSLTLTIERKPPLMPTQLVWKTLERYVTAKLRTESRSADSATDVSEQS